MEPSASILSTATTDPDQRLGQVGYVDADRVADACAELDRILVDPVHQDRLSGTLAERLTVLLSDLCEGLRLRTQSDPVEDGLAAELSQDAA